MADQPHSAVWFGEERDFWWNADFLALMAARLGLGEVRSALDVGAGIGHWGRALAPVLAPDARVVGVEPEREWVEEARRRADAYGLGDRFEYVEGVAEALPFEEASFDLVTCQTVLIHVADPRAAIREMLRVARPGGLVLAAEPNNMASVLVASSVTAGMPVDDVLELVRFALTCERGKQALGEGSNSVGDLVPGYLAAEGAVDVRAWVSDQALLLVPPYEGEEQRVRRDDLLAQEGTSGFGWTREEALRLWRAGGGDEDAFSASWERRLHDTSTVADAVRAGTFHSAGGSVMYLVSGRRPE